MSSSRRRGSQPAKEGIKMENVYSIYITTNKKRGSLYIGVTNDLVARIYTHKNKTIKGFTSKYNLDKLVYFEHTGSIESAITREKN